MECMKTMKEWPGIAIVMLTAFKALYILLGYEVTEKEKNH
jgi:hypothetical protein